MVKKWKANWLLKIEVCFCWESFFLDVFFGSLRKIWGFYVHFKLKKDFFLLREIPPLNKVCRFC